MVHRRSGLHRLLPADSLCVRSELCPDHPDTVPGAADQAEQRQERAVEHLEHFEVSLDVTFGSFVSRRPRVSRRGLHVGLRLSRQRRRERRQSCDVFARALPSGDVKWCALLIRWPMLKNVFWMNSRFPQK